MAWSNLAFSRSPAINSKRMQLLFIGTSGERTAGGASRNGDRDRRSFCGCSSCADRERGSCERGSWDGDGDCDSDRTECDSEGEGDGDCGGDCDGDGDANCGWDWD